MAGENKSSNVVSAGAAVMSAIALINSSKRVNAMGEFSLDGATKDLLVAIARTTQLIAEELDSFPGGAGVAPNGNGAIIDTIICEQANKSYQARGIIIQDDRSLVIKALPGNVFGSLVYVTIGSSNDPLRGWPLQPNESISWKVHDASIFWVFTNVALSGAVFSAEQK
jgi:hypothetical protein